MPRLMRDRAALLAEVGDHLTVHIASEEEIFYPAVHAARTEDILLESLEEHLSLKRLLADLMALAPAAPTFEPKFKVLKEQTEHHPQGRRGAPVSDSLQADRGVLPGPRWASRCWPCSSDCSDKAPPRQAVANQTGEAAPLQ
jgi:hypothetical protein